MEDGSTGGKRVQPTYPVKHVGELPAKSPGHGKGGRGNLYHELFADVKRKTLAGYNGWYLIAEFSNQAGASVAAKAIRDGERKIPPGRWEIETRRVKDESGEVIHSELYAQWLGESGPVNESQPTNTGKGNTDGND